jgi:hypothetical protein
MEGEQPARHAPTGNRHRGHHRAAGRCAEDFGARRRSLPLDFRRMLGRLDRHAGQIKPNKALRMHLASNLVPPVRFWYVPSARRALKLYDDGELDRRVLLPSGRRMTVRDLANGAAGFA